MTIYNPQKDLPPIPCSREETAFMLYVYEFFTDLLWADFSGRKLGYVEAIAKQVLTIQKDSYGIQELRCMAMHFGEILHSIWKEATKNTDLNGFNADWEFTPRMTVFLLAAQLDDYVLWEVAAEHLNANTMGYSGKTPLVNENMEEATKDRKSLYFSLMTITRLSFQECQANMNFTLDPNPSES